MDDIPSPTARPISGASPIRTMIAAAVLSALVASAFTFGLIWLVPAPARRRPRPHNHHRPTPR